MAAWAMLLGMATLINVTMTGAVISLAGNIPNGSLLVILTRYLGGRGMPRGAVMHPVQAASRLARLRRKVLLAAAFLAAAGAGITAWALFEGWGTVAMLALTAWLAAANAAFLSIPLGLWRRRAGGMGDDAVEEAESRHRSGKPGSPGEEEDVCGTPGGGTPRGVEMGTGGDENAPPA